VPALRHGARAKEGELVRARLEFAVEPISTPMAPLPQNLPNAGERRPLSCPYCWERSASPEGLGLYQCHNPKCTGGEDPIFQFTSILVVDAARGARLLPWRDAFALAAARRRDPLAALRG